MAVRKPIVIIGGKPQRLGAGDTIEGATASPQFGASNGNAGAVTLGQPVYISGADQIDLAKADASGTAMVVGLVADASIAAAAAGNYQYGGVLSVSDWTAVTGSVTLTPGANYYLSAAVAGQLVEVAPDATGQQLTFVGRALNVTDLMIEIARPVGL